MNLAESKSAATVDTDSAVPGTCLDLGSDGGTEATTSGQCHCPEKRNRDMIGCVPGTCKGTCSKYLDDNKVYSQVDVGTEVL